MKNKIVMDNKRRGTFGPEFQPGDYFAREVNGNVVIFRKFEPVEPPLVRARTGNGKSMSSPVNLSRKPIVEAICQGHESRASGIEILPRCWMHCNQRNRASDWHGEAMPVIHIVSQRFSPRLPNV